MKPFAAVLLAAPLAGCMVVSAHETASHEACAQPAAISRTYASPTAFYSSTITIPPGYETVRLPGTIPDPLTPGGSAYGDTEQQAENVFGKIAGVLRERGASEADVVAMTVYLVAPTAGGAMDFDGMMRAYSRRYGSASQPNRPVRSTVQVAGLARPGVLVEIEVTAAVRPATPCDFKLQP